MKHLMLCFSAALLSFIGFDTTAHALGLKIAPLEYRTTLKSGEQKKGFIDISNPENESVLVHTSVQAFRQTDNNGTLEFYDNEQLNEGVKLDLENFELGPREAIRMYFLLDSRLLPSGDVYGGIFFTTEPTTPTVGSGQSVRLGTLLSIINGTPSSRSAEILDLDVPSFLIGDTLRGSYTVKNAGHPEKTTAFYPDVQVRVWPFGEKRVQKSNLVFAGRARENTFSLDAPLIGFYEVSAKYNDSRQAQWVFVAHPTALIILGIGTLAFASVLRLYRLRQGRAKSTDLSR